MENSESENSENNDADDSAWNLLGQELEREFLGSE
jgi:hypothetical protein